MNVVPLQANLYFIVRMNKSLALAHFQTSFQFITHQNERFSYLEGAYLALIGGCDWIQLRMKGATDEEVEPIARKLKLACEGAGATFILDDRVELVKKLQIDGVHLGKNDMPVDEARKFLGDEFIIGGTANTFDDIRHLHEQGLIEPDAVFITGFCGDLPAGSFVFSPEDRQSLNYSTEFLAKLFYYDEYFNYDCASSVDEQYIDEIKQYITEKYDLQPIDFQSFVQLHDALFTVSRPGKFVVNANRCFELCGHEWLLPLWDRITGILFPMNIERSKSCTGIF